MGIGPILWNDILLPNISLVRTPIGAAQFKR